MSNSTYENFRAAMAKRNTLRTWAAEQVAAEAAAGDLHFRPITRPVRPRRAADDDMRARDYGI